MPAGTLSNLLHRTLITRVPPPRMFLKLSGSSRYLPPVEARQTLLFSATVPKSVQEIAKKSLRKGLCHKLPCLRQRRAAYCFAFPWR